MDTIEEFANYMMLCDSIGRLELNKTGDVWFVSVGGNCYQIRRDKGGRYGIWKQNNNGLYFKQEKVDTVEFGLFRCYYRDLYKAKGRKTNTKTFEEFYRRFCFYLTLKHIKEMRLD